MTCLRETILEHRNQKQILYSARLKGCVLWCSEPHRRLKRVGTQQVMPISCLMTRQETSKSIYYANANGDTMAPQFYKGGSVRVLFPR